MASPQPSSKRQTARGTESWTLLRTALVLFSAVHLGTSEFIRNSYPSSTVVAVPAGVIANMVIIFQVVPFVLLFGIDLWLSKRRSPKAVRRYRAGVFAATGVLVLRQNELHMPYAQNFATNVERFSPALYMGIAAAAVVLVVWLIVRYTPAIYTYLGYFAPVAIVLSIYMTQLTAGQNAYYEGYDFSEVATHAPDKPPVFVIVFDEFSYEALLDSNGQIDSGLYPNFARLGRESLHLTNATTNYFRTRYVIPQLMDSVVTLSDRYEVRLYEQTHRVESLYAPGCGKQYTCRGIRYMLDRNPENLISYLGMRAAYDAMPGWLEDAAGAPLDYAVRKVGAPPTASDPLGFHVNSSALLDQYLADISRERADGRVFMLHTLLPHYPFVFDAEGEFEQEDHILFPRVPVQKLSEAEYQAIWDRYREQIAYADRFLGEFLSRLEDEGLYDDAVIVVTADHGLRPVTPVLGKPIEVDSLPTHVPMFVKAPGIAPRLSDVDYQHVDFGATLLDVLGYEFVDPSIEASPVLVEPVSALSTQRPERRKELFIDFTDTRYWRYAQDPATKRWILLETVEMPLGDRTLPYD
jgi:hypothetical protein